MGRKFINLVFYGNFFYGFAAILLAVETSLKLNLPLNSPCFYVLLGAGTVYFYTLSYSYDQAPLPGNLRAQWIFKNKGWLQAAQWILLLSCIISAIILLYQYGGNLAHWPWYNWVMASLFPIAAVLYYGITFPGVFRLNLRSYGLLKPVVIGAVWTGAVTVYPVLMYGLQYNQPIPYSNLFYWFLIHNLMYITILCIMFDVKDYAADHNHHLQTLVVRRGLRKTIFKVVIPLVILGIISYSLFWYHSGVSGLRLFINFIPIAVLLWVAYSMHKRRSILYYLVVIDGLMAFKGLLGMLSTYM